MPCADAGGPTAGDPGVTRGCEGRVSREGPVVRVHRVLSRAYSPSCEVRAESPYVGSWFYMQRKNKTPVNGQGTGLLCFLSHLGSSGHPQSGLPAGYNTGLGSLNNFQVAI